LRKSVLTFFVETFVETLSEFADFWPGFDKVDDKVLESRLLQQALAS